MEHLRALWAWGHRRPCTQPILDQGCRETWGSATCSLSRLPTLWGSLGLAGQAVVIVAHALFHGLEVRAVLPAVGAGKPKPNVSGRAGRY